MSYNTKYFRKYVAFKSSFGIWIQAYFQIEVDMLKNEVRVLTADKKKLQEESVNIQVRAEQEEEFISNTLLKKIQELKKEKVC